MSEGTSKDDAMPTRRSGAWAWEKLQYVSKYQDIFATGMSGRWSGRAYLDLLAGPGVCQLENGEEFPGSPLLSLDQRFTARVFVEADPRLAKALEFRCYNHEARVLVGDCNAPAIVQEMRAAVPKSGTLGLAFVDNLGTDVTMATLQTLTEDRPIDLIINFQLADFTRNIRDVLSGKDDRGRMDAFFGTSDWETLANDASSLNASPSAIADALLEFYGECLKSSGYGYLAGGRKVMRNSRGAAQYRLLFASKSAKGLEFFRKIEEIDPYGQRSLL
jgi:three-Cys-motif partner protein